MPPSKSLSVDDFLSILKDDRVRKEFYELYEPLIKLTIDETVKVFRKDMQDAIDSLNASVTVLRTEVTTRDESVNKLKGENVSLTAEVNKLKKQVDDLEQYGRRDNLIISGLPLSYAEAATSHDNDNLRETTEATIDKVISLCREKLDCDIHQDDISVAHRLPATGTQRSVIVKFTKRLVRDRIYRARTKLKDYNKRCPKDSRIFINEDLSPMSRGLFSAAWRKQGSHGIESVWTVNCHVMMRQNGNVLKLLSLAQLNSLCL